MQTRYRLAAFWPLLLLATFVPTFGFPSSTLGYLWNVEFAFAAFLLINLLLLFSSRQSNGLFPIIHRDDFLSIILPVAAFTVLSGLSMIWAVNVRNATHHTLLWACYLFFYFLVRQVAERTQLLSISLKVAGIVILILGSACVIEYLGSVKPLTHAFSIHWYKHAEALATLLPAFLALAFSHKTKTAVLSATVALTAWLVVLLTPSRTILFSSMISIAIFFAFVFLFHGFSRNIKRVAILGGLLLVFLGLTQISFTPASDENTTFKRLGGKYGSTSANSRLLFWGIALEAFQSHPFLGVGADNYISIYRDGREALSQRDPSNKILEINEDVIPERAHSEYLQILSELGLVGGLLFGWLLCGVAYVFFLAIRKRAPLLTVGALSGIAAFLIASAASSYSFRLPANGLCFFFLLALAARGLSNGEKSDSTGSETSPSKPWFVVFGIAVSISMLAFCAVRALSLRHLANCQNSSDPVVARNEIERAMAIDPSEPMFRFCYGQQLYLSENYDESIPQIRLAIENGIATSTSYFTLLAAYMRAERDAEPVFVEALKVYPRSVFLRTAFAAFLKRRGDVAQAEYEFQKAVEINPKQARSWQVAHDEGLERLVQVSRTDSNYLSPFDLLPANGPLVLAAFQRK